MLKHIKKFENYQPNNKFQSVIDYFNMSQEEKILALPDRIPYMIEYYYQLKKDNNIGDMIFDFKPKKIIKILKDKYPDTFFKYGKYLYDLIISGTKNKIKYEDYPFWYYAKPIGVVNNEWLIHFTKNTDSILNNGFIHGTENIDDLGITFWRKLNQKKGGYNFAFTLKDYLKHKPLFDLYGKYEAILFKGDGFNFYHNTDKTYEAIFIGKDISINNLYKLKCVYIERGNFYTSDKTSIWALYKNDKKIQEGHLDKLLKYVNKLFLD